MAINPNFVFSDPRIQQGVVQMAQIAAAEEAARLQRQAQSQQSFTQAQVARENAAAERARNDAYLNQREREAARSDVTLNKDLDLRRTEEQNRRSEYDKRVGRTEVDKDAAVRSKAQFDTLAQLGSNPDDPPTPREWASHLETYGAGLSPEQKKQLTTNWQLNRDSLVAAAKSAAGIEAEINRALDADPTKRSANLKTALDQYKFLRQTPDGLRVLHSVRVPREDAPEIFTPPTRLGPGAAPPFIPPTGKIPTIEDFLPKTVPQPPVRFGPGAAPYPTAEQLTSFVPGYISTDSPISGMPPAPPPQPQPSMVAPSFFPNTGTGGFTPAPSRQSLEMPPWMYSPIFGNNGLIGPTGIVGRGLLGQNQGIPPVMYRPMFAEGGMFGAPQAQQIPPPPFVPQYLSTDSPPRAMMPFVPPPSYPRLSPFNY